MTEMLVSICMPSIRPDTLGDAIASVKRQTHQTWELIVIGQGDERSMRAAVEAAADGDERVRYTHVDRFGANVGRNQGVRQAKGELLAFLDDDCEAAEDWVARIVATFDEYPDLGLLAGSLVRPDRPAGSPRFAECPEMIPLEVMYHPAETGGVSPPGFGAVGANLAVRRSVAEAVGPYDELLGPGTRYGGADDTDYVLRAEALPTPLRSDPALIVNHTHGFRFGLRGSYRILRAYAAGNGALAAKLTLLGDRRGREWAKASFRMATVDHLASRRPQAIPGSLLRHWLYRRSYRQCLREHTVRSDDGGKDPVRAVLVRLDDTGSTGLRNTTATAADGQS